MAKASDSPSPITVFVEKVGQLSRAQRVLICVAAFAVVAVAFVFLSFKPNWTKISTLKKDLKTKQEEVETAKRKANTLGKLEELKARAENELKLVAKLLPKEKELPQLLEGISQAGADAGLEGLLFEPGVETIVEEQSYAEMPVKVIVAGGYHGIASFFDKVSKLPRIINIRNITIEPSAEDQGGWRRLEAKCQAVTYRFLEPGSMPDAKDKKK